MKKTILFVTLLFVTITVNSQFYVSGSVGYSFGTGKKVLGEDVSTSGIKELKGSYGEGIHTQLRGGYFFNEKFGVELGFGYLHGTEQDVKKIAAGLPGLPQANINAYGRAFGASLSGVYNITSNFYARIGVLTKVGGRTQAQGNVTMTGLPLLMFVSDPSKLPDPRATGDLTADFTTKFKGKIPFGFTGAIGYKFPVADNWSLFVEADYMGINVTRDTSRSSNFSGTLAGREVSKNQVISGLTKMLLNPKVSASTRASLKSFLPLLADEAKWGEGSLPSSKAPYSSIGLSLGIIYTFK